MRQKPKILVFSGYGLNCEAETKFAFEAAGGMAEIVHINDLILSPSRLFNYQILAFPGGFAYGDDTGSGRAYALKLSNHLEEKLKTFIKGDRLVIGICNGFQILANLGFFPLPGQNYGEINCALIHNTNARYSVRWVDVRVTNDSPWLRGLKDLSLPIAHGEGKFFASRANLQKLNKSGLIALKYFKGEMCNFFSYPANPNGSLGNIAGLSDKSKKVLGLMPHPERAQLSYHLPHFTYLKEIYRRSGKKIPKEATGMKIFRNGIDYFTKGA